MSIRWVQVSRVSLQRAGVILAVVTAASESRRTTIEALSRSYSQLLRTEVVVSPEQANNVAEYLRRMRLWQRYPELHEGSPAAASGARVEVQDLWLADPRVPSASGAITERVLDEPVQLALALRLLRPGSHTLTARGTCLRVAAGEQSRSIHSASVNPNPMVIPLGAGLLMLHAFLDADYDFLRATYDVALDLGKTFSRPEISRRMGDVCRAVHEQFRGHVRTGEDRQRLTRLAELAESIDSAGKAVTWGGARPPDQTSTLRLEPLVDLGVLTRSSRFEYAYTMTAEQRQLFEEITTEQDGGAWLSEHLVHSYLTARSLHLPRIDPSDAWVSIRHAWEKLRSPMGYASIDEALLLAIAELVDSRTGFFELASGRQALRDLQRQQPHAVRFTMARGGALSYFRLAETGILS